jgi:co-chaperonin GroES (HSP10)
MSSDFKPYRIKQKHLRPTKNNIVVSEMSFTERKLNSGIVLLSDNGKGTGIRPRWGQVYAVGPEQTDIKIGQWILVSHGRWTRGINIEDETGTKTIRKIDPSDVLLVSDELPDDETMSDAIHIDSSNR